MTFKTVLSCVSATTALGWSWAALAQEERRDDGEEETIEQIVVTGSRIAGASDSGAIAITTLSAEEISALGESSTGDILANLPQAGSFEFNESSDGPNDARGDVATVNLRGLGTGNTLILLNGRRITAHGINQDIGAVPRSITNVNAFPAAAIDRIEVLRDGASALYGADATAGVVNTILSTDFDDTRITARFDRLEGTGNDEIDLDVATGLRFNDGRTRAVVVGSVYQRDGLFANELGNQFNTVDKRAFLGDSPWAASTDFRNTSSNSPFGTFEVVSSFDRELGIFEDENVDLDDAFAAGLGLDDADLTSGGRFHVQPCGFTSASRVDLGATVDGAMCIGENSVPTTLRYDFNGLQPVDSFGEGFNIAVDPATARGRQLLSEADRYNFYTLLEHDFANGLQAFGDVLWYRSETTAQRATSPLSTSDFIIVPASNYYNPFGPVGSPNRLDGLEDGDVPDAGYDLLIRNWRPQSAGPRIIETESWTYRVLAGLRGEYRGWDWESAVGYSENETTDRENRISKTRLTEALGRSTPDALNPFGSNANSAEALRALEVPVVGVGETYLFTADLRASHASLFETWAGSVGAAFGIDYRIEGYSEDRDPRIDGTIQFDGNGSGVSDIVGISPTEDSSAHRNVYAAFGEALVPLRAASSGLFTNEVILQLAVRGEYFDDISDSVVTPKIALSWFPTEFVNLRAAYSEGFRAPNLIQLNRGDTSRVDDGFVDFVRENAIGNPEDTGDANLRSVRISNPELEPEDTETTVVGLTLQAGDWADQSWLPRLAVSIDFWRFEQTGVIDDFGVQENLALDFVRRADGGSNPDVIRAPVTPEEELLFAEYNAANPGAQVPVAGQVLFVNNRFINLDRQEAEGWDFSIHGELDTGALGSFDFRLEFTRIEQLDVFRNEELAALTSDPRFEGEFDALAIDQIGINGDPEDRATANLLWRRGDFGAGLVYRYVSGFTDTSADNVDVDGDGEDDLFEVDSWTRLNGFVDYRFDTFGRTEARLRLGVNNLTDEAPPLADESLGFETSVHNVRGREYYVQARVQF